MHLCDRPSADARCPLPEGRTNSIAQRGCPVSLKWTAILGFRRASEGTPIRLTHLIGRKLPSSSLVDTPTVLHHLHR